MNFDPDRLGLTMDGPVVYTVTELTLEIKTLLEEGYAHVRVEGEVSNFKAGPSGHAYFSLKDEGALLSCVMWRNTVMAHRGVDFADGNSFIATGKISVYAPRGQYQLVVTRMEPAGLGALQKRFEEMKRKLQAEGLFDEAHKVPLPALPSCVAVITSPTGAAVRDFLRVIDERYPGLRVIVHPVRVQGAEAAAEIADAIATANRRGEAEALVVTRGGGSLEDLWPFNEEVVARAIHRSRIPVISAVGHEVDFTIADLVADYRAPTPTAAAVVVSRNRMDMVSRLLELERRSIQSFRTQMRFRRERIDDLHETVCRHSPVRAVEEYRRRLDDLLTLAASRMRADIALRRLNLRQANARLPERIARLLERRRAALANLKGRLTALTPEGPLRRGFAVVTRNTDGQVVTSANDVAAGDNIQVRVRDGGFGARVE